MPLTTSSSINANNSSSSLPIYYNNVRSITNKRNISTKIELSVYKVLCFTETKFDKDHSNNVFFPSSFNVYRCDRKTQTLRRCGGVAVLVHHTLKSRQIEFNSENNINEASEFLTIEIFIKPQPLIIYICYLSKFDVDVALNHYQRIKFIVEKYRNHRIISIGDFNLFDIVWTPDDDYESVFLPHTLVDVTENQDRSTYNANALDFLEKMLSLPLSQLSNFRNKASNVLDLVFVNNPNDFTLCDDKFSIIDSSQQDPFHIPYEINVDYSACESINVELVTIYQYARGNYERMCMQLEAVNFQHEFNMRNVDDAYEFFCRTMKNIVDQNVPKVTIKKYTNKQKWWTSELQRLKNRRDKLYKRKSNDAESMNNYEIALNEFNELSKRLEDEYHHRIQENMKSDPAEFWKFARMNRGVDKYPNEMRYNEKIAKTKAEIVNLFADHFESICVPDDEPWNFDDVYVPLSGAVDIDISLFDIEAAIYSLKWKSGAGPDGLKPLIVKSCASVITWPIWLLYQKSFDAGKIAKAMKLSRIVPVYKRKGDKNDVTNYRVVAIQPVVMKVHEIAVNRKLSERIYPSLSNPQHAFRDKRSVVTNLLNLSILAHKAFERSCQLDVFYGDFRTAFDTVWIRNLMIKFARFGFGKKTAKWTCEFLTGRTNYVQIDEIISRIYESTSGVPPGTSVGPLMFNVYIDDIDKVIVFANILLFADDIKLAAIIYDHNDTYRLQQDIDNSLKWCEENRLYYNNEKCFIFSAYRNNNSFIEMKYTLGDHTIERVEEMSDLGVLVDKRFYMGHHIEQMTIKSRQMVGCIKHYSNGKFTLETQRLLYIAYVRSRLEFASTIWNPSSNVYKDDIESIQKQFVIYLLDSRRNATSYRLAPYIDRCKQVGLQPLETRRTIADAVLAYNIYVRNIKDDLISSKFVRDENELYAFRDSTLDLLIVPRLTREYLLNQPIVRLIRLINDFKNIVTSSMNRFDFKNRLIAEIGDSFNE